MVHEDTWAAGGTSLGEQLQAASGSEDRSLNVNNTPEDTVIGSLPFNMEENALLQAMLTKLTENMVGPAIAAMERGAVGLRMSTQLEVDIKASGIR